MQIEMEQFEIRHRPQYIWYIFLALLGMKHSRRNLDYAGPGYRSRTPMACQFRVCHGWPLVDRLSLIDMGQSTVVWIYRTIFRRQTDRQIGFPARSASRAPRHEWRLLPRHETRVCVVTGIERWIEERGVGISTGDKERTRPLNLEQDEL